MPLSANSSPLEFFSLFMDGIVLKMIVDGTNEYARMVIDEKERTGKLKPNSRWRKWSHVTINEMKAVLALIINMGILPCPEREGYWKTSWESYILFFMMSFLKINLRKYFGCFTYLRKPHLQIELIK